MNRLFRVSLAMLVVLAIILSMAARTQAATASFSNATQITIPASGTSGRASPYPSNIMVSGVTGTVSKVTVTLTNIGHTYPDDIDILLVSPAGQKLLLMSDTGGTNRNAINNVTLTFDDDATASLPDSSLISSGTYKPTNFGGNDTFPLPAPTGPYGTTLAVFNGENPNGTWSLYVVDDLSGDTGQIAGGWSLTFTTSGSLIPPTITITSPDDNAEYLLNQTVTADYFCEDETGPAGVVSCDGTVANGAVIETTSVGSKTFTVNAEDIDGNTATLTHNYTVVYNFSGFFQPVSNLPTFNKVKAGSTVPVKFSLDGNQGLNIFAANSPASKRIECDGSTTTDSVQATVSPGSSTLTYDATTEQYQYVWKTDKAWAETCRVLIVTLNDGMEHLAYFDLTR